MQQDQNILQVNKLSKYFGGLAAVSNCSLKIRKGSITGIIGPNGSGKTTQIRLLADYLGERGIDVHITREPGGTQLGETLREMILHSDADSIDNKVELLLMFAARSQHVTNVIKPRLSRGQWVLSDRFTDATFAYQGGGREMEMEAIEILQTLVQGDFRPNKTIPLDQVITLDHLTNPDKK